ncbi:MAG: ACP S-malonyltransferase [Pseudomonadota bacterium]|nr:ACP S-malonyltransferase [Pseudomonadota bacterium]
MLVDLTDEFIEIKQTYAEASAVLGYDLWQLIMVGPEEQLNSTERTQPALLAGGVALWRILRNRAAPLPQLLAGHSLGEYTALVCAEALTFADALMLVAARGRFMQDAVPAGVGAMAAIVGLEPDSIAKMCADAAQGEVLSPANLNAIGQTVIAGNMGAVERALLLAEEQGAKLAKMIPVSVPSHCALMEPAKLRLLQLLERTVVQTPKIPVLHNVDVQTHEHPDDIRQILAAQLVQPVRWVEIIQFMADQRVNQIWECGPGKVLAGLIKRIDKTINVVSLSDLEQITQTVRAMA